jgi:predicted secreted protein
LAFTHGKAATFWITDAVPTLRNITTYLDSTGLTRSADLAETSTLGSTYKSFVAGLIDGKIPLSGLWDPTVDGYLTGILQLSKAFEYFPAGLGTGNIKEAGNAILTSYEISTGLDGAATFSAELQIDGAVIRTVL